MKSSLMRPTAALFPIVLLLSELLGSHELTVTLLFAYFMLQLLSLCSTDSFRNAAAREPGRRRVDQRFSGAFLVFLLGTILSAGILIHLFGERDHVLRWIGPLAAAAFTITEQMFEERMFALSHRSDGMILSLIANLLLLGGLLLDSSGGVTGPIRGFYTAAGAGLGMLISIVASYIIEPMRGFSLIPRNIGFFPKAAVQTLLYPAVVFALANLANWWGKETFELILDNFDSCVLFGFVLWRLSRTVCRRASDESRPLNLLLVAVCGGLFIGSCFLEELSFYAMAALLSLICAEVVFCAPGIRLYTGTVLLIASMNTSSPENPYMAVCIGCAAVAIILNLHKAFLKKV